MSFADDWEAVHGVKAPNHMKQPRKVCRAAVKIHFFSNYNEAYLVGRYAEELGANFDYDCNGDTHVLTVCGTLTQIAVVQGFVDGRNSK